MKHSNKETEIDMREILRILRDRLWIILLAGIVFMIGTYSFSRFVLTPVYESTTKIYIINVEGTGTSITYSDLQTGSQLTQDYMQLIVSRPVTEQVIKDLDLNMSYGELASLITVNNPANTRILDITVKYTDPIMAKEIADAVRGAAADQILKIMNIDQVNVVEEANVPTSASKPNILKNTVIGAFLGILIACLIVFTGYFLDDTIKTGDDVEKYLGISVLSAIPAQRSMVESGKKSKARAKAEQAENAAE
ncbi:YveK family protein [Parasporobacterium paucivorans]|uniref:Capsular polysaccharide biosynthesis protein n=1 Tax=Parasporobacterium paucivorans DSM 15970 TaxID=1122934 RepID=A0A1M6GTX0_9FIRM|nr:Wzz/FepE/Etk N-terminal domain-containing protein [Parasporobacterium paucivorans]SHJ13395.1 Capsular polysaccharide biosynthesis protein [Parasporobacterium paucivorans DSM 15970]